MSNPEAKMNIDWVRMFKGNILTVWANLNGKAIQLEIRITRKGKLEVFSDTDFEPIPFEKWAPMS